jgi:hypothetical protein
MRLALRTITGVTIAASLWLFVMYFILQHPGYQWRAAMAAGVAAIGLFVWFAAGLATPQAWIRVLAGTCGIAVFAAGAWAMRTNVDEGFVDVISVLLMTEGVLTLAWTAGVSRLRPAHRASTGAA